MLANCSIIIMAAGLGQRMNSSLPKVLHEVGGIPLLTHVLNTSLKLTSEVFVVYGYGADQIRKVYHDRPVQWVFQEKQCGTGHAVAQVLPYLKKDTRVMVLNGDVPFIQEKTLRKLFLETSSESLGLLVFNYDHPYGLGRILRNQDHELVGIMEEKDASTSQKQIQECYTGILTAPEFKLKKWLDQLSPHNQQGEYYLTDIVKYAFSEGEKISSILAEFSEEVQGVNTREQLSALERFYQQSQVKILSEQGVTFLDPHRFNLRGELNVGQDVVIDVDVIIKGQVSIGKNTTIGPFCILENCEIGENVKIESHTVIQNAKIQDDCIVGPFARIRPETSLAKSVKIGSFVEIKKSEVGENSKIPHLSYIGDSIIGEKVNIGAGVITCNYDGKAKYQTTIQDRAFIGSDTQLIAPVVIGEEATVGAGTTVTQNVPSKALAISRVPQRHILKWIKKIKK